MFLLASRTRGIGLSWQWQRAGTTSRNVLSLLQGTSRDGAMGNIPLLKESHTAKMIVIVEGRYKVAWHRVYI